MCLTPVAPVSLRQTAPCSLLLAKGKEGGFVLSLKSQSFDRRFTQFQVDRHNINITWKYQRLKYYRIVNDLMSTVVICTCNQQKLPNVAHAHD